jgi:hypothetical protein
LFHQNEFGPSILSPSFLVMSRVQRSFFSIADDLEAPVIHSHIDKKLPGGIGPLLSQGQVVLHGTTFVAMSLDPDDGIRVFQQLVCVPLQNLPVTGS